MKKRERELFQQALDRWGFSTQILVLLEEMAELQVELVRYLNRGTERLSLGKIDEEMADVELMIDQMKLVFNNEPKMAEIRKVKLKRLRRLLKDGKEPIF